MKQRPPVQQVQVEPTIGCLAAIGKHRTRVFVQPPCLVAVLAAVLAFACAAPSLAQDTMDGRWTAHFSGAGSEHRRAELVVQGTSGTWTPSVRSQRTKDKPPASRPLSLVPGPSSTYLLRVSAGPGIAGCKSRQARLTVVDPNTLEGEFDDGRVLRLVRP